MVAALPQGQFLQRSKPVNILSSLQMLSTLRARFLVESARLAKTS
jgi:hypothetical protein